MRSTRPLAALAVAAATLTVLGGCTRSGPATTGPAVPAASSSVAPASIDITISDRQVSPNGVRVPLTRGQTVVLHVTSDADDEIHAHTGGDGYELEVEAGVPATGQFVASDTGSFEVESHHLDKIIAVLVVR